MLITPDINLVPVEYIRIVKLFLRESSKLLKRLITKDLLQSFSLAERERSRVCAERLALIAAQEEERSPEEEMRQKEEEL